MPKTGRMWINLWKMWISNNAYRFIYANNAEKRGAGLYAGIIKPRAGFAAREREREAKPVKTRKSGVQPLFRHSEAPPYPAGLVVLPELKR
jgi:hypothetical protein